MREGKKDNWIFMICCMIMIIPILIYTTYSIPAADDFANGVAVKNLIGTYSSYWKSALVYSAQLYRETSGYYFAAFVNLFCQPFLRAGLLGIRLYAFAVNSIFFISLFIVIRISLKEFVTENKQIIWVIYTAAVFCLVNNHMNSEIYTWYVVLAAYIFPVTVMFMGISCFILAIKRKKISWMICASVCGFLVSGSSLNVTALNCGIYLLISVAGIYVYSQKKNAIIPFVCAFAGGVINTLSPGNFSRHDSVASADYTLIQSVKDTIVVVGRKFTDLFFRTPFLVIAIIVLIFILSKVKFEYDKKIKFTHPFWVAAAFICGVFVVDYPVCLGYATRDLPDRTVYIQDIAIYILFFIWLFYFAGFIKKKWPDFCLKKEQIIPVLISCLLFVCVLFNLKGVDDWTTTFMIKSIVNGSAKEYAVYEEDILKEIENSRESDIIITREYNAVHPIIKSIGLTVDTANWVNQAVSNFYNKKSVTVVYKQ